MVVLTYNSVDDLANCLDGVLAQVGVNLRLVVVDNASKPEARKAMESIFFERTGGAIYCASSIKPQAAIDLPSIFVRNNENAGYSAGNNIGLRILAASGCEAVLLVNPDVRISDPEYIRTLWDGMRSVPDCVVASSRLKKLDGRDEHPLREAEFWEELLWWRQYLPKKFHSKPFVRQARGERPIEAEKLHGSCMLLRSSFLREIQFLDENVFLYSEEPILAARARDHGGRMLVFPGVEAVHAHVPSAKGNSSRRMLLFIKSRLYYLQNYTNYGRIEIFALRISYSLLGFLHKIKARFSKA